MIQSLTTGGSRDKKLLAEAQQMLADSKAKIEFLRMRILKVKQSKNHHHPAGDLSSNGDQHSNKGNVLVAPVEINIVMKVMHLSSNRDQHSNKGNAP